MPAEYITQGGSSNADGVLIETDKEPVFVPCTVLKKGAADENSVVKDDDVAYVYASSLKAGDVLIGIYTDETTGRIENIRTTLGVVASVEGVYQINSGFCVFKPVVRLSDSIETAYVIVSPRVAGGIQPYDRIVMNAEKYSEQEILAR